MGAVQAAAGEASYGEVVPPAALAALEPEAIARVWAAVVADPPTARPLSARGVGGGELVGFVAIGPLEGAPGRSRGGRRPHRDPGRTAGRPRLAVAQRGRRSAAGQRVRPGRGLGAGRRRHAAAVPDRQPASRPMVPQRTSRPDRRRVGSLREQRLVASLAGLHERSDQQGRTRPLRRAAGPDRPAGAVGRRGQRDLRRQLRRPVGGVRPQLLQTCALSLLLFSGGSQFAFVGIVGAGGRAPPRSPRRPCSGCATASTGCS